MINQFTRSFGVALLSFGLVVGSMTAAPNKPATTFQIKGAVNNPQTWSAQKITRELSKDIKTVRYSLKGKDYSSRCVPLLALILKSRPQFPSGRKHPELRFLVKIQGRDGYSIWNTLSELHSDFGNRTVYMALDVNGKPFSGVEAPVRLLVPSDKDHGRWIYGIKSITVVDGNKIR